jgi:urease accessory protein
VRVSRQDAPWKVVRAFSQANGSTLVHLHNVSGGVLAGDRLALEIDVASGAAAQVTTTGATRLYRHRPGAIDSGQHTNISIGDAALLEYLPDPIIPYAGARHVQRTQIRMGRDATLFWWEVFAPGRQAAGETFAFDQLTVKNEILSGARLVLRENYCLDPLRRPLTVSARMGCFAWIASFYIAQEGRALSFWRTLEEDLNEIARERTRQGEAIWGASTLAFDGVVVKGLSTNSRFVHSTLGDFWQVARKKITGVEAVAPRKTY